jgi:hypothetical protein
MKTIYDQVSAREANKHDRRKQEEATAKTISSL